MKSQRIFDWPVTKVGQTAQVSCGDGNDAFAKRVCKRGNNNTAVWQIVDDSSCFSLRQSRARRLSSLASVSHLIIWIIICTAIVFETASMSFEESSSEHL